MGTIEASDEVSEEFRTSFKHSEGHVWNASLFSGIQVLYIYIYRSRCQKQYTYIHNRYSYLRFSVIYIDKFSVRDEPTYNISRS